MLKFRTHILVPVLCAASATAMPKSETMPTANAAVGPCSVELSVVDSAGNPVPNVEVKVHVRYGLLGRRSLDLTLTTNQSGNAQFTGMPKSTKAVLLFRASTDKMSGMARIDPPQYCHSHQRIHLSPR